LNVHIYSKGSRAVWHTWLVAEDSLDNLKLLPPLSYLSLDRDPFLVAETSQFMSLYNHFLVHLVYPGVDDVVCDGVNGPLFDIILADIKQLGYLREFEA